VEIVQPIAVIEKARRAIVPRCTMCYRISGRSNRGVRPIPTASSRAGLAAISLQRPIAFALPRLSFGEVNLARFPRYLAERMVVSPFTA